MYCRDYQNTLSCTRGEICPYIHVTKTEQILYIRNANTMKPVVWREMLRTKQVGKICKRMNCSGNCGLKHFKVEEAVPLLCRICYCSLVSVEDGVVLDCCRHFFCEQCVLTLISADEYSCPLCRTRFNNYIKLKGNYS